MATVNLGAIRFNWKGAYNNGTAYVVDDVVSSAGNSYICILASTGNAVSNATYWSIMSSAGTNGTDGTDVGTTITTQGDVLYRDGSGLQRLAKGTASQSLTMNAGATAPEWTTPAGGGFIRLGGAAFSAVTTVTISPTGFDMDYSASTGYDVYKLFITSKNSHASQRYYVYLAENGGSSFNDSNPVYNYVGHGQEGTGSWDQSEYGVNAFWIGGTDVTTVNHADQLWHNEITMIKPLWAARSFTAHMQFTYYEGTNANGSMNGGYMGWTAHGMTGVDAISLSRNTGGNLTGYWTMYGLKS